MINNFVRKTMIFYSAETSLREAFDPVQSGLDVTDPVQNRLDVRVRTEQNGCFCESVGLRE